jgi:ABC-type proline/glycine betaine transport system ATPase subunit
LQPELPCSTSLSALRCTHPLRLLTDLQGLLRETRITAVFITHDLDEAPMLGDQVAVLDGRLRQVGTPAMFLRLPTAM